MLSERGDSPRPAMPHGANPDQLVETLRERIAQLEGVRRPRSESSITSGCELLNHLLPAGGFSPGTLVEWLAAGGGSGVETLALFVAREACREGGTLVVFDRAKEFYPPEAIRLGIAAENLLIVQAASETDNLWALDQALRCPAVAAVLAWPEKLESKTFRRLQLAAEEGGGLGFFFRPEKVRQEPSWAEVRLLVEPLPTATVVRRFRIHLLRGRGGTGNGSIEVEFDHETCTLHAVPQLNQATTTRRVSGA